MKLITKLVVALIVTLSFQTIKSQTANNAEEKLSLNSGTLDNQFEYVIRRSPNWREYKTVKKIWLYALKAHTLDSLKVLQKQLSDTKIIVNTKQGEIDNLKNNLSTTQTDLATTNEEKNNMALLGMQTSKTNYNVIMWSIISVLLAMLLLFIYKFKGSNSATRHAKHKLSEVEVEFEEHRRIALEREQKVRRQLQDEINKQKS
ncbi:hypothetical protein [Winogradskyella sp. PG-2]|uniref:hypothetical protein n=1 Tax=Winogradskyella sp. PG-2 TaxID=754409 RepID=UPI0004586900|nr:hypothetical protein [Winogradskyella sp. PG-2]BAO74242.1 hypothetical protein WPG_0012 [Winogradskyella sp. PG-2]